MQYALPLIAGLVAASAPTDPGFADQSRFAPRNAAACSDRIQLIREERGLPPLRFDPDAPAPPILFKAVDREIDGCDVLVSAGNPENVRPIPQFAPDDFRVRPVKLGQ